MNWNDLFEYRDGQLFNKMRPKSFFPNKGGWESWVKCHFGKKAGFSTGARGYLQVKVSGSSYLIHRIVWEMHNGDIPAGFFIDHIDRDRANNRIENLRLATPSQNRHYGVSKKSKHGLPRGVKPCGNSFQARIEHKGKRLYLGSYKTPEEASEAYRKKSEELYGEFATTDQGA